MAQILKTLTITTDDSGLAALVDDANASIAKFNDLGTQAQAIVTELEGKMAAITAYQSSVTVEVTDPNASAAS